MINNLIIIALGGAIGSLVRYAIGLLFSMNYFFMVGVLIANILGCFLMGIAQQYQITYHVFNPTIKLLIYTGFFGGLTTFSALMLDVFLLYETEKFGLIAAYIMATFALSILGFYAGKWLIQ